MVGLYVLGSVPDLDQVAAVKNIAGSRFFSE